MFSLWSNRQKLVAAAGALAFLSMFLSWSTLGIRKDNGWDLGYYLLLLFWVYPIWVVFKDDHIEWVKDVSILITFSGLIALVSSDKGVSIGGSSYLWSVGSGAYVYALALGMLIIAEFFIEEMKLSRACPHCAELIKIEANICRYCGLKVEGDYQAECEVEDEYQAECEVEDEYQAECEVEGDYQAECEVEKEKPKKANLSVEFCGLGLEVDSDYLEKLKTLKCALKSSQSDSKNVYHPPKSEEKKGK